MKILDKKNENCEKWNLWRKMKIWQNFAFQKSEMFGNTNKYG